MLALERRNLILEKLQAEKRVVVSEPVSYYTSPSPRDYAASRMPSSA